MSELKAIESATAVIENVHLVYIKAQADKVIAELKAREDVLFTDNRDLLEKVKMLEERLHENAEHYKRNEAQIIENADKVIAEKDTEIRRLKRSLYKACANWADVVAFEKTEGIGYDNSVAERWRKMESKCLKKAEEAK